MVRKEFRPARCAPWSGVGLEMLLGGWRKNERRRGRTQLSPPMKNQNVQPPAFCLALSLIRAQLPALRHQTHRVLKCGGDGINP